MRKITLVLIVLAMFVIGTADVTADTFLDTEKYSDDNISIVVDYINNKVSIESKMEDVTFIKVKFDEKTQTFDSNEGKVDISAKGVYHEMEISMYKQEADSDSVYDKKFSIIKKRETPWIENKRELEKIEQEIKTEEYPLLEKRILCVSLSEKTEVKLVNQLNGDLSACIFLSQEDLKPEKLKEELKEAMIRLAFPNLSLEKTEENKEII